jgi:aryl-alcohol dehydrogenase-like predicted oxidoreductase
VALSKRFRKSLDALGETQIEGLLVHRCNDLLETDGQRLFDVLAAFRDEGLVKKIGVSVYTPHDVKALLQRFPLDIVQLPLNPFDQRHLLEGSLALLADSNIEVHVRSAFLQGLLIAGSMTPPAGLEALSPFLAEWETQLKETALDPIQACFAFLRGIPAVSTAICGVTSLPEWQAVVAGFETGPELPTKLFKKLAVADVKLIDPRYWPKR